jgi:hypothetical protein
VQFIEKKACNFSGHLLVVSPRSEFLALVSNLQPELPALTGQHHAAEFLPGDFSTIDDEERYTTILDSVPLNPALHDLVIRDLQPKLAVLHVSDGQGAADLFDQPPKQHQQISLWITDYLKLISSGMSVAKFKGIQGNAWAEQTGPEMKHMGFTCAVSECDVAAVSDTGVVSPPLPESVLPDG